MNNLYFVKEHFMAHTYSRKQRGRQGVYFTGITTAKV